MFFTDSKMKLENAFVFDSALLSASEQTQLGVLKTIALIFSDHYPIMVTIISKHRQTSQNLHWKFFFIYGSIADLQISNEYNDSNGSIIITDIMGRVTKNYTYTIRNLPIINYLIIFYRRISGGSSALRIKKSVLF